MKINTPNTSEPKVPAPVHRNSLLMDATMHTVSNTQTLNHNEIASLIVINARVGRTTLVEGNPGIGKSDLHRLILDKVSKEGKRYSVSVIDCQTLEIGDLAIPTVNPEEGFTRFLPNQRFQVHSKDPVILVLDEIGKSGVINSLLPLMLENRLGDTFLPEGSIVYATTNLASDKLGDAFPPHARNRVCSVTLRPPTVDEWLSWGADNNVSPDVMSAVRQYPNMLASYTDPTQADNPYIYNPGRGVCETFASGRSLALCSEVVRAFRAGEINADVFRAGVCGWLGLAAGHQVVEHVLIGSKMPTIQEIQDDPRGAAARVDANRHLESFVAMRIASQSLTDPGMESMLEWSMENLSPEGSTLIACVIARRRKLPRGLLMSPVFRKLLSSVTDLLGNIS